MRGAPARLAGKAGLGPAPLGPRWPAVRPQASHVSVCAPGSSSAEWEVYPAGLQGPLGSSEYLVSPRGFNLPLPPPHPRVGKTDFLGVSVSYTVVAEWLRPWCRVLSRDL